MWSLSLGIEHGWISTDPATVRGAATACGGDGNIQQAWTPAQVGGGPAPAPLDQAALDQYPWPPKITGAATLRSYTQTGTITPLPTSLVSGPASQALPTGWLNRDDDAPFYVPIAGQTYPSAWPPGAAL